MVRQPSNHILVRIVDRMAKLTPPRHRELVQGMLAELDAIVEPAERRRFALGAMAAIVRLTIAGHLQTAAHALKAFPSVTQSEHTTHFRGTSIPAITTTQLLRRHVAPFVAFTGTLTVVLIVNYAAKVWPYWMARDLATAAILEVLTLAVPFTLALTVPMGVFLGVSWVFTRLGSEGVLTAARRERGGVRRLVVPVLCAAAVISTFTLVSNAQLLPRANARLLTVVKGDQAAPNGRTMTIGELQAAARTARAATGADGARAAGYEVEIHKKFALAAACLFLALAGMATAIRFPHGGVWLMFGATAVVFTGYYASLVAGESFADRQLISPLVAMWMANAFLLAVGLLFVRGPSGPARASGQETMGIG
jgi:lipopolysaccharide export LptBFGC system permease protein LptF